MSNPALTALSPLDGRYAAKVAALRPLLSEFGLMHRRVQVEIEWFIALSDAGLPEFAPWLSFGASPRATINLTEGARALARLRLDDDGCRERERPAVAAEDMPRGGIEREADRGMQGHPHPAFGLHDENDGADEHDEPAEGRHQQRLQGGTTARSARVVEADEEVRQDAGDLPEHHEHDDVVGEDEADLKEGRISVSSPIARAMIGRSVGDVAEVRAPGGIKRYEIVEVRYQ